MNTKHFFRAAAALSVVSAVTAFIPAAPAAQQAPFADKFWILESSVVTPAIDLNMDGKPDTDIRVMMEDCEKDDTEMYKTGGKLIKNTGNVKCDEDEESQFESGTWQYDAATKKLTHHHYDTEKPETVIVKEVSANRLVISREFTSNKGKHTITATLRAK
ncbi:hypothetical protein ACWKWU_14995 [Chitinophaga lutea]